MNGYSNPPQQDYFPAGEGPRMRHKKTRINTSGANSSPADNDAAGAWDFINPDLALQGFADEVDSVIATAKSLSPLQLAVAIVAGIWIIRRL